MPYIGGGRQAWLAGVGLRSFGGKRSVPGLAQSPGPGRLQARELDQAELRKPVSMLEIWPAASRVKSSQAGSDGLPRLSNTYYYTYMKKLTITVSDDVYEGLRRRIGARRISGFIDRLARPYVDDAAAEALYREAENDPDRAETVADWDELPADEALDDQS